MAKKQSNSSPSVMLRMLASSPFRNTSLAQTSKAMEERMHKGISFAAYSGSRQSGEQCGTAYNHQCIENVASYDIADSYIRASFQGGRYADRQFRGRRSESDDCQSDNDVGYTETLGYGRSSVRPVRWHLIE